MTNDFAARRLAASVEMYKQGNTLAQIGATFGVTRERIRQILKSAGLTGSDGGASRRALLRVDDERQRRLEKAEKKERWSRKLFGCSLAEYKALGDWKDTKSPPGVYFTAARNARRRGIQWQFTLPGWWGMWQQSGQWNNRGSPHQKVNKGRYVMARYGDSGPYSEDNARIIPWGDNSRECQQMQRIAGKPIFGGKGAIKGTRHSHCKNGHEFTIENIYFTKRGRICKTCNRAWRKKNYAKRKLSP